MCMLSAHLSTTLPAGSTSTRTPPASITTIVWLKHPSDWLPVQRGPGVSPLTGVVFSCSRSRSPSPRGVDADAVHGPGADFGRRRRAQASGAGVGHVSYFTAS